MTYFQLLKRTTFAFLLFSLAVPSLASTSETPDFSPQVDELFTVYDSSDRPGAAVAVIQNGEIVYQKGFGMADLERSVLITPESVFEIGSISKQFTAMCIMLLENDGKLTLDDNIRKYVPEMPEYDREITLRHLLHHTSGVRDIETLIPLAGMNWFNYYTDEQMLELITRQKGLNFPPGEQFLYSNSGYILLAQVISRVSGQSLREFAQKRIFDPLGMKHTVFWDQPGQIVPNRALAYSQKDENGYRLEMWNMPFAGPAGVYSTVGDLALWDSNFYNNKLGGGAVLIKKMETPGLLESGEPTNYGAGLSISTRNGLPMITHNGAWMGYRASMSRYPEQHLSIVILSNAGSIEVSASQIANIYLDDHFISSEQQSEAYQEPAAIDLEARVLVSHEGMYWNESRHLLRVIEVREGKLHYVRSVDSATELGALEEGRFFMVGIGTPVSVEFEGSGEFRTMTVAVDNEDPMLFEIFPVLSENVLATYTGSYWSAELGRELQLSVEGKEITASWADEGIRTSGHLLSVDNVLFPKFVPVPWYPQDTRVHFEHDGSGAITGLSLSCDMARGVSFEKLKGQRKAPE
jgi:CubicO group peptidase (beta-lactamase class C family)